MVRPPVCRVGLAVDSFGSVKYSKESGDWDEIEEEALVCFCCGLERGSCMPVLVENLPLIHAHEPVESYNEH